MNVYFEKPLRAILIAMIVTAFIAAFSCFIIINSKYLETFTENILPVFVYIIASFAGFVFLALFTVFQLSLISKRKVVSDEVKDRDKLVNTSSGWIDVSASSAKLRKSKGHESEAKRTAVLSALFGIASLSVFTAVYALSSPPKAVIEFTKKPVDRLVSNFRVVSDLVFSTFFLITVVLFVTLSPKIISGEWSPGRTSAVLLSVVPIACAIRSAYFFFGNILAFASPADFAIFALSALTAGLFLFSSYAERRRRMIEALTANQSHF